MNYNDRESKIIVWLAILGFFLVTFIGIISLLVDRDFFNDDTPENNENISEDWQGDTLDAGLDERFKDWTYFGIGDYGVAFFYPLGKYEIVENPSIGEMGEGSENTETIEIVDCRKMSASLRESVTSNNTAACYEVKIVISEDSYIVITTGDSAYQSAEESYIQDSANPVLHIFPESKINLPQERITIDDFPTNFQGKKVIYENGQTYMTYEGIVYKGADKYAIMVFGDIGDSVEDVLSTFDLE